MCISCEIIFFINSRKADSLIFILFYKAEVKIQYDKNTFHFQHELIIIIIIIIICIIIINIIIIIIQKKYITTFHIVIRDVHFGYFS